jgi:hypothetical protein
MGLDAIQMLWVRGDLSRFELLSLRSFLANGHPVDLYTSEQASNLPAGVSIRDAREIVPESVVPDGPNLPFSKGSLGSFSDYFRYHLLHARGGWWSDMDIVCVKPWRFVAPALTASTTEEGHGIVANTCVMRFSPGHALMAACRAALADRDVSQIDISQTGPLLLQAKMSELGLDALRAPPSTFCPVPWNAAPVQLIRPQWRRFTLEELKQRLRRPHLSARFTADTVAVHLWNEMWRAESLTKDQIFPKSCLYERLQRRWNRPG